MKLLRVGTAGAERPALLDQDGTTLRDLSGLVTDIDGALLADDAALDRIRAAAASGELPVLDGSSGEPPVLDGSAPRIGPPLARIGKIVCIGLNYHDHAAETGAEIPAEPIIFFKAPDTVVGPDDTVLVPRGASRPTGRSNSRSSSAVPPAIWTLRRTGWRMSPGTPSRTMSPSASSRSSAAAPGTRARTARRSTRWAPGW